jgi:hypothetical protein
MVGLVMGSLLSAAGVLVSAVSRGSERIVVMLLLGAAFAAGAVLLGRYENGSHEPLALYALGLANTLLVTWTANLLASRSRISGSVFTG